ncbi:DUF982 domain-containing protein [Sinorhizobium terangae]|uniref:DUF982 domain-containing protein n=1 Tax=Sinorhizobium terangae TaxID=110322 RepID=A0A6N7LQT5_SINTE|nr:DUF982 domain-containing protein [Sinorhizobium terangae]MBB4189344.1 hypothetical protein [Sinorhizobium terangae]MQX18975.1 DUF982 domain-containing protein [Sinorhizobium terangae]MQX19018.1 DUF982 domain-containing protein [Sinorhizobium terangae]WFU49571.1 DUF982 domain-containing protein [Sinorhizobium terangae]
MNENWGEAVIVQLGERVEIVWTPAHAVRLLNEHWTIEQGAAYLTALNQCTDAMFGIYPWEQARASFIAAVEEAKIKKLR